MKRLIYLALFLFLMPQIKGNSEEKFQESNTKSTELNQKFFKKDNSNIKLENQINLNNDVYLLGPGDIINIDVLDLKDETIEHKIQVDGSVYIPFIGRVFLSNLTIDEAIKKISLMLSNEILNPEVTINLKNARPVKVSLIGEIERPGIYSLTNTETSKIIGAPDIKSNGLPTVVDAIQKAGGITKYANLNEVVLKRKLPGISAGYKQTKLNLLKLILDGEQINNPFLYDGDVIKINKTGELTPSLLRTASANLSPSIIKVTVIGEVLNPGQLELNSNTPLIQAVLQAGGQKPWKSNKNNIELIRINRDGSITRKRVRFNIRKGISENNNPPLSNGDVVIVNSNKFAKTSSGIKVLSEPISGLVTSYSLLKILNE